MSRLSVEKLKKLPRLDRVRQLLSALRPKNLLASNTTKPIRINSYPERRHSPPTYRLLHNPEVIDDLFFKLRADMWNHLTMLQEAHGKIFFREWGRTGPKRHYFFVKPSGELGWLFERSGPGWILCLSEKIVGQGYFLRRGEALDAVQVFVSAEGQSLPKVSSELLHLEHASFAVYSYRMVQFFGEHNS